MALLHQVSAEGFFCLAMAAPVAQFRARAGAFLFRLSERTAAMFVEFSVRPMRQTGPPGKDVRRGDGDRRSERQPAAPRGR